MIRIAIGTERRTEIARKVLEFSILSHTEQKVEFHSLLGEDYYDRGKLGDGTGFSRLRFGVPELFNYQGRAIYLDADMLCLANISELWEKGEKDLANPVWCVYGNEKKEEAETSMMVLNLPAAKGKIKTLQESEEYLKGDVARVRYRQIMKLSYLQPRPKEIEKWWNVMDKGSLFSSVKDFHSPKAKLLHFTAVPKQPWYTADHPALDIWESWLKKSIKSGYVSVQEIKEAIKKYDVSNPRRPNGMHPYYKKYLR